MTGNPAAGQSKSLRPAPPGRSGRIDARSSGLLII